MEKTARGPFAPAYPILGFGKKEVMEKVIEQDERP